MEFDELLDKVNKTRRKELVKFLHENYSEQGTCIMVRARRAVQALWCIGVHCRLL